MSKKLLLIIVLMLGISLVFSAPAVAKTKVAFALLWTIDDMGWTTAHYRGIEYLKKKLGDQIEVSYTEKVLAANTEQVLRSYAKAGYDIIFATTFEHMDPTVIVARDFPNVVFEHCSGYKKNDKNMGNYFFAHVSGRVSGRLYVRTDGLQECGNRGYPADT